jgi:hypothetical protein
MILPMTTTGRLQQRYDHRLRDLVHGGDMTIATDLGVPRSTARGWLGKAPRVVVSLDVHHRAAALDALTRTSKVPASVQFVFIAGFSLIVAAILLAGGFVAAQL